MSAPGSSPSTTIDIDQQSTLFFLLSWPTFPLSGKKGDYADWKKLDSQRIIFCSSKNNEFKFVPEVRIKKVKQPKTNLQK